MGVASVLFGRGERWFEQERRSYEELDRGFDVTGLRRRVENSVSLTKVLTS